MGYQRDIVQPPTMLSQQLLLSVVEQLKNPLLNIARRAELGNMVANQPAFSDIRVTADAALQLLDNYILGVQLTAQETALVSAEPVAISSILYNTGQKLTPLAAAYGVQLEVHTDGHYGPVMVHRRGLEAALASLGYALIEALPAQGVPQLRLQLTAHRCRYGIVAGVYCETEQVTAEALRAGRRLLGRARQPLGTLSHTSSAGVFVADAILHAMQSRLFSSRYRRLYGLSAILPLSSQLQLV